MSDSVLYDVIIVGAGLGGSSVARRTAAAGLKVLLLERSTHVGTPVRCGEAAGVAALKACVEVRAEWIGERVQGVRMISPSGTKVDIDQMSKGDILRRDVMDKDLVDMAVESGAQYRCGEPVVKVESGDGFYECSSDTGNTFRGRCLVLADGVESRLARQLGWDTALKLHDMCSCAFGHVAHESVPQGRFEMYYGSNVAPSGYGWVFPRGDGSANVGLGVLGSRSEPGMARECLEKFAERRFPGAELTNVHCAGVPVAKWTRPLVRGGALLVGDAARMVDAMSGGGITYAMEAGLMAGDAIIAACEGGGFAPDKLKSYERAWARGPGKTLDRLYALKQEVVKLDDATLDDIARKLVNRKGGKLGLVSVVFSAFARRPMLLLKALMVYR